MKTSVRIAGILVMFWNGNIPTTSQESYRSIKMIGLSFR
jgi:hypothetical protein